MNALINVKWILIFIFDWLVVLFKWVVLYDNDDEDWWNFYELGITHLG